mgnify:CR=1 FL=1
MNYRKIDMNYKKELHILPAKPINAEPFLKCVSSLHFQADYFATTVSPSFAATPKYPYMVSSSVKTEV